MRKITVLAILLIAGLLAANLYCNQADTKITVKVLGVIPQNPSSGTMTKMALRITNNGPTDIPADSEIYLKYAAYGENGSSSSSGATTQTRGIKFGESFDLETGGNTRSADNYTFVVEELTISNDKGRNIIVQLIRPASYQFRVKLNPQDADKLPSVIGTILPVNLSEVPGPQAKNVRVEANIGKDIVRGEEDLHAKIRVVNIGKTFLTFPDGGARWDTDTPYVKMVKGTGRPGSGKLIKLDPGEVYEDTITLFVTDTAEPGPLKFSIKAVNLSAYSDPIIVLNLPVTSANTKIKEFFSYFNQCADENFSKVKEGMTIEETRALVGGTKYHPYYVPRSIDTIPFGFYLDSTPTYEVGFANRPEGINDFFISEKNVMNVKYYDNGKVKGSSSWPKEKIRIKTTGGVFDARII